MKDTLKLCFSIAWLILDAAMPFVVAAMLWRRGKDIAIVAGCLFVLLQKIDGRLTRR